MHPAKKHITQLLPYILYGLGGLSVLTSGCKKNDDVTFPSSSDIKMEMIPASDTIRHVIASNTLLTANHPWYIDGWGYVTNEATLRMEAGAEIKILPSAINKETGKYSGGLIISRGAHINAEGTASLPIRLIVKEAPDNGGSGIIVLGKASGTKKNQIADNPDNAAFSKLAYGGLLPDDSSGVIRHVHISYYPSTGRSFQGGLLLLGTGKKTVTEYITIHPIPVKKAALKNSSLK